MKRKPTSRPLHDFRNFSLPAALTGIVILIVFFVIVRADPNIENKTRNTLMGVIPGTIAYILGVIYFLAKRGENNPIFNWVNSILAGLALWWLAGALPEGLYFFYDFFIILATVSIAIFSGRLFATAMISIAVLPHLIKELVLANGMPENLAGAGGHLSTLVSTMLIIAFVGHMQKISLEQVARLEVINSFSRRVASTLDHDKILALLDQTLPTAMSTDSYYLGIRYGDVIHVPLFFDDGQYFNNMQVECTGTLSGWVIEHQQELFLPDLRRPLNIDGIKVIVAGQEKASLSWIGVPLTSSNFKGLIALASYQYNAFNQGDIELLANLAQHTALALENAARHAEAQERSRLDSLTGVFNHGYFLELLEKHIQQASAESRPFSIIMLDVDHFKQYNDIHGHLLGDNVLTCLCTAIRENIKSTDAVGRWGGEEFIICLPDTSRAQAVQVAQRIRATMLTVHLKKSDGIEIKPPTISQGIAQFPHEADETFRLIDLADKRLYIAKHRGRDQIEPPN